MDTLKVSLEVYNGPLDLLLTLIQKNKLNILDIPIAEITGQYMKELEAMREQDIEVTADFIVMASQLMHMKSKALLPRATEGEEDELTPEELSRRLVEYQKIKMAAKALEQNQFATAANFFKKPEVIEKAPPENKIFEKSILFEALSTVLERLDERAEPTMENFKGIVHREKISLPDMIDDVWKKVRVSKRASFYSVFDKMRTKTEVITAFLAILHLISRGRIKAIGEGDNIILENIGDDNDE